MNIRIQVNLEHIVDIEFRVIETMPEKKIETLKINNLNLLQCNIRQKSQF